MHYKTLYHPQQLNTTLYMKLHFATVRYRTNLKRVVLDIVKYRTQTHSPTFQCLPTTVAYVKPAPMLFHGSEVSSYVSERSWLFILFFTSYLVRRASIGPRLMVYSSRADRCFEMCNFCLHLLVNFYSIAWNDLFITRISKKLGSQHQIYCVCRFGP